MDKIKYSFKPIGQVSVFNIKPSYNISFRNNDGQEIGKLDFNGPALVFTGDAEESAKVLIDWAARSFAARLEDERKSEREQAIAEPVREPVYVQLRHIDDDGDVSPWGQPLDPKERHTKWAKGVEMRLLYTTPPAQPAEPLTDEQIDQVANSILTDDPVRWWRQLARAIEAAHGITKGSAA
jgi:hypothetical protein